MAALHANLPATPRHLPAPPSHVPPSVQSRAGMVLDCKRLDKLMKSGRLGDALDLFDRMPRKNVVAWTSAISGCTRNGRSEVAVAMFLDMLESGVAPNDFACNAALVACADAGELGLGEQVHSLAVRAGLAGDAWVGSCLIELYARCGALSAAKDVFDRMESPGVVGYTSIISALCRNSELAQAVEALCRMTGQGLQPNEHTTTSILAACPPAGLGEQIHGYTLKTTTGLQQNVYASTALIDFYSRNGDTDAAKAMFENLEGKSIVSWCSMMQLYIRNGRLEDALRVFCRLISEGVERPNEFAFSIALGACRSTGPGRQLHCSAIKHNLTAGIRVSNALLSMYGRSGAVEELEAVLDKLENPDVVSWTAAISANFQNGFSEKAVELLSRMHSEGFAPTEYAFSSGLSSCADLALLDQGRQLHCLALKLGCCCDDSGVRAGNALVNMYSKCGEMGSARLAFDAMRLRDVASWNSLIHGLAQHGDAESALEAFGEMRSRGYEPDESTFLAVLAGCSHAGLVEEGEAVFGLMAAGRYGTTPTPSHYACMVDMLGRRGRFDEALRVVGDMPHEPDALVWKTLLASCRLHGNLDVGKVAAGRLMELSEGGDSAGYVLMSSIHAMRGEWRDAGRVRRRMDEVGVRKGAGWSWVQVRNEVHGFTAGDASHPEAESIYRMLAELVGVMRDTADFDMRI
jgi:pentatricopeptide repeat protein